MKPTLDVDKINLINNLLIHFNSSLFIFNDGQFLILYSLAWNSTQFNRVSFR